MNQPLRSLLEDGFLRLPRLFPPERIDRAHQASQLAIAASPPGDAVRTLGSLIEVARVPELVQLITAPELTGAFQQLGFGSLRYSGGYLLHKPPGSPPTFWHQDWAFWQEAQSYFGPPLQLGVLIYLLDVDPQNGCPRFLPGSHRRPHPLHPILAGTPLKALRRGDDLGGPAFAEQPQERSISAQRGDAILFDARVLHGAHGNRSDRGRPGITLWYFPSWTELPESIQALAAQRARVGGWPEQMKVLLPTYTGAAAPARYLEHPDLSRWG